MLYFKVGEVLKEARKRHNLTQEELCHDICAVSTLSKIENGRCSPHVSTFKALMQKMGEPESIYVCCMDCRSIRISCLEENMERALVRRSRNILEKVAAICEREPWGKDAAKGQTGKTAAAALKWWRGADAADILKELKNILRMTGYEGGRKRWPPICTRSELIIWQMMAGCLQRTGNIEEAEKILKGLLFYYSSMHTNEDWFLEARATVLYDLSKLKAREGQYVLSVSFCDEALGLCEKYGNFYLLIPFSLYKEDLDKMMGNAKESRRAKEMCSMLGGMLADKEYLPKFEDYPEGPGLMAGEPL